MLRLILFLAFGFVLQLTTAAQTVDVPASTTSDDNQKAVAQSNEADLIEAIKKSDLSSVLRALDDGASPDASDDHDTPALIWAVKVNRPEIAEALLKHQAKVDNDDHNDNTALMVAAYLGRPGLVKLFIAHGADVNHKAGDETPLLLAAFGAVVSQAPKYLLHSLAESEDDDISLANMGSEHLPAVKLLLDAGANVNAQLDESGFTALMFATLGGNVDLAKMLLEHKADVKLEVADDWNALKLAEDFDTSEIVQDWSEEFETPEAQQAFFTWVALTKSGRQEIATLLRRAGAN